MPDKKILVFGAAGFIGTYLIDDLVKNGYSVVASDINAIGEKYYSDNNISYVHVDITQKNDFDKLEQIPYDAVIHLAATQPANVSTKNYDPKNYIAVNVIGTLNILEFCKKNNVGKLIYATSHRNTQGLWTSDKHIREEDGRSIKYEGEYSMFSISETAAQDCITHYTAQFGLKSIMMRLPPVYGYGPHTEIFIGGKPVKTGFQIFIDNAKACKPLEVWGDSSKGRDIIYIKDVISAFSKAIHSNTAAGLFNISSGTYLTLQEEAETIARVFWGGDSSPVITNVPEKSNNIDSFVYDISKARKELDWSPQFNFEAMLIDYKKELDNAGFEHLVEKRKRIFNEG
jgi:UDP-glucose 4-epimerase